MKPYPLVAAAALAAASLASAQTTRPTTQPMPSIPPTSEQLEGQDYMSADVTVVGHIVEPEKLEPTDERVADLKLPDGFSIEKWATDVGHPRMLLAMPNGDVYVTRRDPGDCLLFRDRDGNGLPDAEFEVVAQSPNLHGIALAPDGKTMYLTSIRELFRVDIKEDGTFENPEMIVDDLPDAGQHPNRTMAFGPDGMLYLSVGSTANATDEKNKENATMLQIDPKSGERRVFASGLRNTIGFGWHPTTGRFWGADHGIDWLGDDEQGEEINELVEGGFYGWPYIYGNGDYNPADNPPDGKSMEDFAATSMPPALLYTAHSAPLQMTFYSGNSFPQAYSGDAFIAMRGSWNRKPPSGYEVVRVTFNDDGKATAVEPFLTGFLVDQGEDKWGHMGRLAGIAELPDGSLLLSDDTNGVIYRITYDDSGTARAN